MVRRNIITVPEAQQLLATFDSGGFAPADLPLPPGDATATEPVDEAAVFAFLLGLLGRTRVPNRLPLRDRTRLRERLRDDFESRMRGLGRAVAQGGSVADYQQQAKREIAQYTARQYGAGRGTPDGQMRRIVTNVLVAQAAFIARFAFEIHARRAVRRPYSERNVTGRGELYQGAGYAQWFKANEAQANVGQVIDYISQDDPNSCSPCLRAQSNGPYLPGEGPYPGPGTCRGLGKCRCKRVQRFDMDAWRALTGAVDTTITIPRQLARQGAP